MARALIHFCIYFRSIINFSGLPVKGKGIPPGQVRSRGGQEIPRPLNLAKIFSEEHPDGLGAAVSQKVSRKDAKSRVLREHLIDGEVIRINAAPLGLPGVIGPE
jgi:hypothetical protein